jgi:DNA-binding LytR/AlgR family response regulator
VKAVDKASEFIRLKKLDEAERPAQVMDEYIVVHADHKIYKIKLDDIKYIEGLKEYVSYFTEDKRIIALESLKKLEEILPSDRFMRVHRSYIVPISRIKTMEGNQLEIGGKMIPVGRSYREEVLKRIFGE